MIIKIKKETNYSIISNEPLHDERLSYGARGVLAYLLTLPSNWNINMSHLVSKSKKDGRDKVTGLFSELMELGYAERTEVREKGRFKGYEYTVYEKPPQTENTESVQKTETGLSHTASPKTETTESVNRTLISTNSNKDLKEINTNSNNIDLPVFFKNDHASEIDLLNAKIERLEALIERQSNKEAEGAKCNNVANNELAVLSASIGTSYTKAQESKDKPVKARKNANSGTLLKDCEMLTNKELFIQEFNSENGGYFQRFKDTFDAGMIWDIEITNMLNYAGFQNVKRANWLQAAANWIGKMRPWGVDYNACLKKNAPMPKNEGYDENDPRTWK